MFARFGWCAYACATLSFCGIALVLGLGAGCSGGGNGAANRPGGGAGSTDFYNAPSTSGVSTGGNSGSGSAGLGVGSPNGGMQPVGGGVSSNPTNTCAEGIADTSPVTPTVWLIVDGSGSMNTAFSGSTRWRALRSALMDTGGVVQRLEHSVRFGMVLYAGNQDATAAEQCVSLVTVDPSLDNYATLAAQYPAQELGGYTPTDKALQYVVDNLPVVSEPTLDQKTDPIYVILATDGAPNDRCAATGGSSSGGGRRGSGIDPVVAQRVLDVVGQGAQAGVKLLVISLAGDDTTLQAHLDQVVQVSGSGVPPFVPATKDDLVDTLQAIVGGASCQIALDGKVSLDKACSGQVTLTGRALTCNSDNGFRLIDESTLQLTGSACDEFLSNQSLVHASFPCDVFTPF